jgi:poly-beta-1,6-N-acetyl-D-glucosamine synthase
MKRLSYIGWFFTSLLLLLVLSVVVVDAFDGLTFRVATRSTFITTSMFILLVFLFILLFRYFALLWLSFVAHVLERHADDPDRTYPTVSVVVPAFNEEKVVQKAILSVYHQDYPVSECIVVDDGSTDRTAEVARMLQDRFGPTRLIVVKQPNRGKANALNLGARVASSELVFNMDADSVLSRTVISSMVRHFKEEDVGAVAGNVKIKNRVNLLTYLQSLEYIEGLNMARKSQGFLKAVNIIPGPVGMFRRQLLLDIGGYEADTFAEDCDLTLKLLHYDQKIAYEPNAIVYTEAPEHLQDLIKQRYRWTRGILQSLRKRRRDLTSPAKATTNFVLLWYMIFEGLLWPVMNIFAQTFLIGINILYGQTEYLILWFFLLTVLDMVAAFHCVTMEEEDIFLVPLAAIYRVFFILVIDMVKVLATIEEVFGIHMDWGKLARVGR